MKTKLQTQPVLEFSSISKSFFGIDALKEISFSVMPGDCVGLIGENGAGKSTLMNILGGLVQPDSGCLKLKGAPYAPKSAKDARNASIAFIHQELNLFGNLSIADNIFIDGFPKKYFNLIIDKKKTCSETFTLLKRVGLELSPETLLKDIGPGERQLVEVARALSTGANILIFDEPTTSLTDREKLVLFEVIKKLKQEGASILFISHNLDDVLELTDSLVVLRDGVLIEEGKTETFNKDSMIHAMVGRKLEQLFPSRSFIPEDEVLLNVSGISLPGIVKDINLSLHKGEILGLFGLMGSGRSELANLVFGLEQFESGDLLINGKKTRESSPKELIKNGLAYVTENRRDEGLLMTASVADNLSLVILTENARFGKLDLKKLAGSGEEISEKLSIKCEKGGKQPVKTLSGGNQQKVVIGKWLMKQPSVFIMDEPTRGIDVGAKSEVYSLINLLASDGAGILLISSELEELTGMCDRILVMHTGEIVAEFDKKPFENENILKAAFGESE